MKKLLLLSLTLSLLACGHREENDYHYKWDDNNNEDVIIINNNNNNNNNNGYGYGNQSNSSYSNNNAAYYNGAYEACQINIFQVNQNFSCNTDDLNALENCLTANNCSSTQYKVRLSSLYSSGIIPGFLAASMQSSVKNGSLFEAQRNMSLTNCTVVNYQTDAQSVYSFAELVCQAIN